MSRQDRRIARERAADEKAAAIIAAARANLRTPEGHLKRYAFKTGHQSCVPGRPRIVEVGAGGEVVAWLCLDCDQQLTSPRRAVVVSSDDTPLEEHPLDTKASGR